MSVYKVSFYQEELAILKVFATNIPDLKSNVLHKVILLGLQREILKSTINRDFNTTLIIDRTSREQSCKDRRI